MSHEAIAAALARLDLTGGERLVAFSLASFAGRDRRAWPGAAVAAARAGLSRSRYLHDRRRLVEMGLVAIEEQASGRGRASTVVLRFAAEGPWWEGDINAELFEAVLSRTRARGPARLLLAAMAALADGDGVVRGLSNDKVCSAAGLNDRTYRRARPELVASGELELRVAARGRGNTNVWHVQGRSDTASDRLSDARRRIPPAAGTRPLLMPLESDVVVAEHGDVQSSTNRPVLTGALARKGGHDETASPLNCCDPAGVSETRDGQHGTLLAVRAAGNSAEKPAPNARARTEPRNPGTGDPPNPPAGGSDRRTILVEQTYATDRGRTRRRRYALEAHHVRRHLVPPTLIDQDDWARLRDLLAQAVGESTFAIWLEPLVLAAVDAEQQLVVVAPPAVASWTASRFGRLLGSCAEQVGRDVRFAIDAEIQALAVVDAPVPQPRQEAAG